MASTSPRDADVLLAEDGGILQDHARLYSKGRRLRLIPHKPPPPYGSHLYPIPEGLTGEDMMPSEEERVFSLSRLVFDPRNAPRNLDEGDQRDTRAQMEVEIVRPIAGRGGGSSRRYGYESGPQKVLCRVVAAPSASPWIQEQELPRKGQLLFLKIFDALFWYESVDYVQRAVKLTTRVDGAFSDEFGAYHFLYECGRTGVPDIAPEFYGGWTVQVKSGSPAFRGRSRHVAVLATEFVDGVRLDSLFHPLGPVHETVKLYQDSWAPASFGTDEGQRMEIIKQLMDGTVTQEWLGLDHCDLHPKNVIITMRDERGHRLGGPRAVLVGYGRAIVDRARSEPVKMWEHFPTKHHPILRFSWHRLDPFKGWIPAEWRNDDIDDCPLLRRWIVETFGTLSRRNTEYTTFVTETLPAGAVTEGESIADQGDL